MNELIPIFPLELVVYPGEELNLHIFEPRYRQLIHDSAATKKPFGIPAVLAGQASRLGTLVRLVEISHTYPDGKMDIRTCGLKIFRTVRLVKTFPDKLYYGAIVDYPETDPAGDPVLQRQVVAAVKKLHSLLKVEKKFGKAAPRLLSYDLAHHAGLSPAQEYELLALLGERERLRYLQRHLDELLPVVTGLEALKEKVRLNGHYKILPGLEP